MSAAEPLTSDDTYTFVLASAETASSTYPAPLEFAAEAGAGLMRRPVRSC